MSKITTTTNAKQGKLYAGPAPLPQGAKLIGTVTRDGYDTGALVELVNGRQVQYNAGVIRNLPGVMGRPPMSSEKTTTIGVRLPQSVYEMSGYRLHIEATDTEPTAHATMASVRADQRALARQYGRTVAEVERMSYIVTEAEYQAERQV